MTGTTKSVQEMDLVWGATDIARFIGRSTRSTFYLLENGELPGRKVGGRWVASRSEIERFFRGEAA
ncbi:helix-turn-helix domain-containing protein [Aureimonas altamirensis]|uniref:helix-turn-helix domain-containing protein n=1 Tax=Aureimonas altamirensis TaxID=370622 RepID=UPI00301A20E7